MPDPSPAIAASLSASGYEDGLGRRSLEIDRESGAMLERLHLRPELGAFEAFLRERVAFTTSFNDDRFARVKAIERDGRGGLSIISQFVAGSRLSDLLEAATGVPADEATCPSVDAALGFLLEVLPALNSLHEHGGHAHGTLAPTRLLLTPASQVVVLDWLYGPTIQRLHFNRRRLWTEFGVAAPTAAGPVSLDPAGDVSQASLAAMMIVLGRPLRENEYPDSIATLVSEVIEIAQIRGSGHFASALEGFLQHTLPLPSRTPNLNAADAAAEVRHIAREIGVSRCRTALTAFLDDMNRVLAEEREQAERATREAEALEIDSAVEALAAAMIPDLANPSEDFASIDVPMTGDAIESDASANPTFDEFDPSVGSDLFEESAGAVIPPEPPLVPELERMPEPVAPVEAPPSTSFPVAIAAAVPDAASIVPAPELVKPDPPAAAPPEVAKSETPMAEIALPPPPVPAPQPSAVASPVPTPTAALPLPPAPASAPTAPATATPPQPSTKASKRKKRGSKGRRDKLRSDAAPPPSPPPAPPKPTAPVVTAPAPVAIPMPTFNSLPDPFRQNVPASPPIVPQPAPPKPAAPLRLKADAPATGPIRLKTDASSTFNAPPMRAERREAPDFRMPYFERDQGESSSKFPWRLAAAAVVGVIAVIGIGRAYIPGHREPAATVEPPPAVPPPAPEKVEAGKTASVSIVTQPAGAHVLLDGKPVGDSPVTLASVGPGKHTLTFVTSTGSVKKGIRVEAGKPLTIDVPIYSGWIAVFSPVTLDIAENGKSIGTTEQGRLMLSPGRHQLTFSSREMAYKTTQTVEIEPGEESSISLVPTGDLSANATPWAEVWMNGTKVGDTPIAHMRVPLGTHEIVFKNPKYSDRPITVTVTAAGTAVANVDFTK